MKVAVVTGPGAVELRDEQLGPLAPDDLAIGIAACGLCTMERRLFTGEKAIYPVAPGHEAAGHVVEVGTAVRGLPGVAQIGDLVAVDLWDRCGVCRPCRRGRSAVCTRPQGAQLSDGTIAMGAGLADFLHIPARNAYRIDAPVEHAAMGEPVACAVHSVRLSGLHAGDRTAIVGAGYMGRLHLAVARAHGAAPVGLIDVSAERLAQARSAGAGWTSEPDRALEVGGPQDVVFVTAGTAGAVERAVDLVADGGTVVLYGAFPKDLAARIPADAVHHREISVVGVLNQEPEDWRTAAGLISAGTIASDLDALVTARFRLADVGAAFAHATDNPVFRVIVGNRL
ncbi:MAG: Alcohol dehydrogenase GroES domain protein [Actinomycetia bacterium]|nr:Alcohol dehydrogenase GroES domain protein [Actinomycetes bacterium]